MASTRERAVAPFLDADCGCCWAPWHSRLVLGDAGHLRGSRAVQEVFGDSGRRSPACVVFLATDTLQPLGPAVCQPAGQAFWVGRRLLHCLAAGRQLTSCAAVTAGVCGSRENQCRFAIFAMSRIAVGLKREGRGDPLFPGCGAVASSGQNAGGKR